MNDISNNISLPLISVVVPCYNVEKYVVECLKSIVEQSYDNLEIIVVNDGSTDNTEQEILPFLEDKRIKYIVQKNKGLSGARNMGLDNITGTYVCFVDSDDFIHPDFIKILYQNIVKTKSDIAICDFNEFEDGKVFDSIEIKNAKEIIFSRGEMMQEMNLNWRFCIACSKLYKTELFANLRFEMGRVHEDEFIAHHLFWRIQKVVITDSQLYFYRQIQSSIMNSNYTEYKLKDAIAAYDDRILFYNSNKIPNIDIIYQLKWHMLFKRGFRENNLLYAKKYLVSHPMEFFIKFKASRKEKIKIYLEVLKELILK